MLSEMPYEELIHWSIYFKKRPIGLEEDQRTYLLLQAQGVKEKPEKLFNTFKLVKENTDHESAMKNSLISSGLLGRLKSAATSNHIEWEVSVD